MSFGVKCFVSLPSENRSIVVDAGLAEPFRNSGALNHHVLWFGGSAFAAISSGWLLGGFRLNGCCRLD
ncbi:hypothetical protein N9O40_01585 [Planktomarina sp.]|nr:hypothetical protein [Planktomarina sp.]